MAARRLRKLAMRFPGYLLLFSALVFRTMLAGEVPESSVGGASGNETATTDLPGGLDAANEDEQSRRFSPLVAPIIRPAPERTEPDREGEDNRVHWRNVLRQAAFFTGIQHGFRLATEPGTRNARGPFWKSYGASVASLHGWSDGDPFYVNYIGHPMQGAVSGYIWVQNDGRYRTAEFGANSRYWKSRLRAAAFSFAYSEQFEIGPFSEASIGYIQSRWPQHGFVDHVVTPVIGTGWMVAEDALDRYVIRPLERRTDNPYVRMMLRGWLNPSRSFANMMRFKVPWWRDTRTGIFVQDRGVYSTEPDRPEPADLSPYPQVAPIELSTIATTREFDSGFRCTGGSGEAAFRLHPNLQLVTQVGGCTIQGLGQNRSGDSLVYLVGGRWTPAPARRWSPYAHMLVGGNRISLTEVDPEMKELIKSQSEKGALDASDRGDYARRDDASAFAMAAGTGIDFRVSRAMAFRVASLEYTKSWANRVQGTSFSGGGVQFSAGMILRIGTW